MCLLSKGGIGAEVKNAKRPLSHWKFPPSGRLKINVDGAFRPKQQQGGIGAVVRNESGQCLAAFARPIPFASSALHVEAESCRLACYLLSIRDGLTWISRVTSR